MTRALLVLILVVLCTVPVRGYDFAEAWRSLYLALQAEQEEMVGEIEEENRNLRTFAANREVVIADLSKEVERLRSVELTRSQLANLNAQISGARADFGSVQKALFQARAELQNVLSTTASITTAVGTFTSWEFTSGSMEPAFGPGDLVFLQWHPTDVRLGDVIGSSNSDCLFTHRVVAVTEAGYTIKGDAKPNADDCVVTDAQVSYRVAAVARNVF